MSLTAFTGNVSVVDEATMNALLRLSNFDVVFTGSVKDSYTGSGVYEFNGSNYNHAIYFTAQNTTKIGRINLELVKYGSGADVIVEIREGLNIDGSTDGTLLKQMVLPAEFLPGSYSYVSIPFALAGLTDGGKYWIVVKQNGDSTNHFRLIGEASQNASYPCYQRAGDTGGWTQCNSIHFEVYSGTGDAVKHVIYGRGHINIFRNKDGMISEFWTYLEDVEGNKAIAEKYQFSYDNQAVIKGEIV